MATGMVNNWINVDTLGPIYPFVGSESTLVLIGLAFWLLWHVWQIKSESTEFKMDIEKIERHGGVAKVLDNEGEREISDLAGR